MSPSTTIDSDWRAMTPGDLVGTSGVRCRFRARHQTAWGYGVCVGYGIKPNGQPLWQVRRDGWDVLKFAAVCEIELDPWTLKPISSDGPAATTKDVP